MSLTLNEIRRNNFKLLEQHFDGSLLAKILDYSRPQMSYLRNGKRTISNERARYIEIKTKMEKYWLDHEHPEGILSSERTIDADYIKVLADELRQQLATLPAEVQNEILREFLR